ncbi:hypothetical protein E4T41_08460 [Aureobasidium subglaciale]|nr:hypothetical protein E4T41_08460 [Aureobasidium subglaciale]
MNAAVLRGSEVSCPSSYRAWTVKNYWFNKQEGLDVLIPENNIRENVWHHEKGSDGVSTLFCRSQSDIINSRVNSETRETSAGIRLII